MDGRGKRAIRIAIGCALLLWAGGLAEMGPVGPPVAEAGTFALVPLDHWAYDALGRLAGAVEGGEGAEATADADDAGADVSRPDDPLTRYELAMRIRQLEAEAGWSVDNGAQALLDRLTAEFAPELERLDEPGAPHSSDDGGPRPPRAERGGKGAGAKSGQLSADSKRLAIGLDETTLRRWYDAARGERGALPLSSGGGSGGLAGAPPLPALSASDVARDVARETLRDSLEKLSRLEADLSLSDDARLKGQLAIDPDAGGGAFRLRGASAGLELNLSPTTTLSTAYAIGRDEAADAEHTAKFDLEYKLTPETSLRAAYRLVNFDEKRRASEAEAEISIRF